MKDVEKGLVAGENATVVAVHCRIMRLPLYYMLKAILTRKDICNQGNIFWEKN